MKELDASGVTRAALIASVPGDEESVAVGRCCHPARFVGFFMLDPSADEAVARVTHARDRHSACASPACSRRCIMCRSTIRELTASSKLSPRIRDAVFVHCGALSVGVRQKLGLPSRFDLRLGNPLESRGWRSRFRMCRSSFRTSARACFARR